MKLKDKFKKQYESYRGQLKDIGFVDDFKQTLSGFKDWGKPNKENTRKWRAKNY